MSIRVAPPPVAVQPVAVPPVAVQPVAVQPVAVQPVAVQPVAVLLATLLLATLLLAACGGSSGVSAAATQKTCHQVAAVLADGPDPQADPAGYAEAQILPLSQIHASDKRLRAAIGQLDAAYRQLFASNGQSNAATAAVAAASKKISQICPGAAS